MPTTAARIEILKRFLPQEALAALFNVDQSEIAEYLGDQADVPSLPSGGGGDTVFGWPAQEGDELVSDATLLFNAEDHLWRILPFTDIVLDVVGSQVNLNNLANVLAGEANDGDVLVWDSDSGEWHTAAFGGSLVTNLSDPQSGEILVYTGSEWVNIGLSLLNEGWHEIGADGEVPFLHNWEAFGEGLSTPAYKKDGLNRVWLKGQLKSGDAGTAFFNIPEGYRCQESRYDYPVATAAGTASVVVSNNGDVLPTEAADNDRISLDGISYPVAEG